VKQVQIKRRWTSVRAPQSGTILQACVPSEGGIGPSSRGDN